MFSFFFQIYSPKNYYIKLNVDDSWIHIKVRRDFEEKLHLEVIEEGKTEADPVNYL